MEYLHHEKLFSSEHLWFVAHVARVPFRIGLNLVGFLAACEAYAEGFEPEHGLFCEAVNPPFGD
jgi:hypothetical protein